MSPVGAIFVPFPLKTGTKLLHPLPPSIVERVSNAASRGALLYFVFRLYAFVEAAALRSIVLRYAGTPIATRVCVCVFF